MNIKYVLMPLIGSALLLLSCQNAKTDSNQETTDLETVNKDSVQHYDLLIGSWEDLSSSALHFSMFEDGSAQSDNMATLLYKSWHVENNVLSLVAESIGNKQSSIDTISYSIVELNKDAMKLKQGNTVLTFKKVADKTRIDTSKWTTQTVEGALTFGHETRTFKPCGSRNVYWVSDATGKLKDIYAQLTKGKEPYTAVSAQLIIKDKGKSTEGFAASYQSVYEVIDIASITETSSKDCRN